MSKLKKIVPRGLWVLILPAEKESHTTEQGLLIPENEEQEQKAKGTVQSVGSEVKDIEKGDEVIYGAFAGENMKRIEDGNEIEYKILLEEDIIAFLK